MGRKPRYLSSLLLGAAFVIPALTTGCAEHHYYRAYDPDHGDYHTWNNNETVYYQQWETTNHYDHRDFKDRDKNQQKQYYDWRHQHVNDHDRDHDHDKDHDHDHDNDKH
ncbi:MAG TPA: hypothetical protein VFA74_15830 [Terriglobales bacterium]|nr:hypothetical protein [Terriglobales bacterium]